MDPLLTPKQVAEILGISDRTVNQLCNRSKLRFIAVDAKHRRFTEEMVQEFLDSQAVDAQKSAPKKRQTATRPQPKPTQTTTEDIRKEIDSW